MVRKQQKKITKNKNKKDVSKANRLDGVFLQSNLVNNDHQMNARNAFPSINLSPSKFVHLKSYKSEFSEIKVWFMDQDFRLLKIENKVNLMLFKSDF